MLEAFAPFGPVVSGLDGAFSLSLTNFLCKVDLLAGRLKRLVVRKIGWESLGYKDSTACFSYSKG